MPHRALFLFDSAGACIRTCAACAAMYNVFTLSMTIPLFILFFGICTSLGPNIGASFVTFCSSCFCRPRGAVGRASPNERMQDDLPCLLTQTRQACRICSTSGVLGNTSVSTVLAPPRGEAAMHANAQRALDGSLLDHSCLPLGIAGNFPHACLFYYVFCSPSIVSGCQIRWLRPKPQS